MTETLDVDRIVSADDHMDFHVLPPDLFTSRLPSKLAERAPRVEDTDDEGPYWVLPDGTRLSPSGRKLAGLLAGTDHGFRPSTPEQRLEDMDKDGVYTQVIYGPPGGVKFEGDNELTVACLRAYNDWAAEFNSVDRNRLICLAILPGHDPAEATEELQRVADLGHRGVLIEMAAGEDPIWEDSWVSFWDAANEIGIPVHTHLGGGLSRLRRQMHSWRHAAMVSIVPMQMDECLVGMCFSGMLEKRPNVRFVLGESGLGWIPYVLDRMDHEHEKYYEKILDYRTELKPSEIFARQVVATYEEDDLGLDLIEHIGLDNVMWASDYPHGDSTWPHSREAIMESQLGKLSTEARQKVLHDTAARVYGIS